MEAIEPKPNLFAKSADAPAVPTLSIQDWGLIDYSSAMQRQMDLVDLVHQELSRETLIFCSHPPVVTIGRATREGDICGWTGETIEVNRGGRSTYHGPNQQIVYPILDLSQRGRDLHLLMRNLELAMIGTLAEFGIQATGRGMHEIDSGGNQKEMQEATGVWIGHRKIASIGLGVRKWVSFHGLALNIDHDEKAFTGLRPCGFAADVMISMEEILGRPMDRELVKQTLKRHLTEKLAVAPKPRSP